MTGGRIAIIKRNAVSVLLFSVVAVGISLILLLGQQSNSFSIEYSIDIVKAKGVTYSYNLWDGLHKLHDDKLYVIYTFLLMWSGIFPYLKIAILLISVCVLKNQSRINMLQWLGFFGKWSFADIWTIVLLSLSINLDGNYSILHTAVRVYLQAVALDGARVFLIGIMLSQIFTIVILLYYKSQMAEDSQFRIVPQAEEDVGDGIELGPISAQEEEDEEVDATLKEDMNVSSSRDILRRGVFSWQGRPSSCNWMLLLVVDIGIVAVLITSLVCLFYLPLIHITYQSFDTELEDREYTLSTALQALWQVKSSNIEERFNDSTHLLCLVAIFMVLTFPVLQHVMLLILWTLHVPLDGGILARVNDSLDVVEHLSSLEVFLATLLVVIRQVHGLVGASQLAKYITIEMEAMQGLYIVMGLTMIVAIFRKLVRRALALRQYPQLRRERICSEIE